MPPSEIAKKIAKKAAKKAAKKGAKKAPHHHHEGPRHEGKDLRRAYEHLGRLTALESVLSSSVTAQIRMLTELAESALHADDAKSAADLLRAGEHLAFGSLASKAKARKLSETLEATLNAEYEHLVDKAAEHWERHAEERPAGIEAVYESMVAAGVRAGRGGAGACDRRWAGAAGRG